MSKPHTSRDIRIGVDYFPEHWSEERWPIDAKLMVEAGMRVARIAEFTWSKIQPRRDEWDWEWLDKAVGVLADAGLEVILCTPTACPPPWMIAEDPTILPILDGGRRMGLGARRHYTPHHPDYRAASIDIAQRMAERYGQHPAVIGFQIDNELCGLITDTGPLAQEAFQAWLAKRHGDLKTLDERLGLIFWGQQYAEWDQIPVPTERPWHPGLRLEFLRFESENWISFCRAQAEVMRPHIGDRILTTNCYLHRWGAVIDWSDLVEQAGLDRFSFDNYSSEASENAFYNDLARSLTPNYWILEQQCGLAAGQHLWPDEPGRIHHFTEESARRGAEVITYFRWRQCRFGQEQDHGAILDHDGEPGRVYKEVAESCARIASEPPAAPRAPDVGIVFSWSDSWAMESGPTPMDYSKLVRTHVHRACFEHGQQVQFCFKPEDIDGLPVVLLAAKLRQDDAWEAAIEQAVSNGATVILLPLGFAKDQWNAWRENYQSERMRRLQGARLIRRIPIADGHELSGTDRSGVQMRCTIYAEEWQRDEGAESVARFHGGPIDDRSMVIRCAHGPGSVVTVAGFLDHHSLGHLLVRYSKQS